MKGFEGPSYCVICLQDDNTVDHLLITCPFAKRLWTFVHKIFWCLLPSSIHVKSFLDKWYEIKYNNMVFLRA